MAFGPVLEVVDGKVSLRLRPIEQDDLEVIAKGMRSQFVLQFLTLRSALTLQDVADWYEKTRQEDNSCQWGIELFRNGASEFIGKTALHDLDTHPESSIQIFDSAYWGLGIASAAHIARTYYAFQQLGLLGIRSCYFEGNDASDKALVKIGCVETGVSLREKCVDGKWRNMHHLQVVNPCDPYWQMFWCGEDPPAAFQAARQKTFQVLERAGQTVKFA